MNVLVMKFIYFILIFFCFSDSANEYSVGCICEHNPAMLYFYVLCFLIYIYLYIQSNLVKTHFKGMDNSLPSNNKKKTILVNLSFKKLLAW